MKKNLYSKLLVLSVFGCAAIAGLAAVASLKVESNIMSVKAADPTEFNSPKKLVGDWNGKESGDYYWYLIEFDKKFTSTGDGDQTNLIPSIGDKITLNGTKLSQISNDVLSVNYAHGGKYFAMIIPKSLVVAQEGKDACYVHIEEGAVFKDYLLPEITLKIDLTTKKASVEAKEVEVTFTDFVPAVYGDINSNNGWFTLKLTNYPVPTDWKDITKGYYKESVLLNHNFLQNIYVNGDESKLLINNTLNKVEITYDIQGKAAFSISPSSLNYSQSEITSVTIKAGTTLPILCSDKKTVSASEWAIVKELTTISKAPVEPTKEYKDVKFDYISKNIWGNHFNFVSSNFEETTGSHVQINEASHNFNFKDKIYLNGDPTHKLFAKQKAGPAYGIDGKTRSIAFGGSHFVSDYDSATSLTIPAGTEFPGKNCWDSTSTIWTIYKTTADVTYVLSNNVFSEYDTENVPTLCDFGGGLESFTGEWSTGEETAKGTLNLAKLPNRTLDVSFDWKVSGSSGSDSLKLSTSTDLSKDQGVWFYHNADGAVHIAEVNCSPSYDKTVMNNISEGTILKIRYVREYNEDFTGFKATLYFNGFKSSIDYQTTINDGKQDISDANSLYFYNIKGEGAVRSVFQENYSTNDYTVTIKLGEETASATVKGGSKLNDVFSNSSVKTLIGNSYYKYVNDIGCSITKKTMIHRDMVVEAKIDEREIANFVEVNAYNNNKINEGETDHTRTYLKFDKKPTTVSNSDNIVTSEVTFSGIDASSIQDFKVWCGDIGDNFILIDIPVTAYGQNEEYPYDVIHFDGGFAAHDILINELNLYLDSNSKWQTFTSLHKVILDGKTMYIPDGLTIPMKDLSKYCSATFKDENNVDVVITEPVTKDMVISSSYINHDFVKHNAQNPTCTVEGNIEYYTCKNESADHVFVDDGQGNKILKTLNDVVIPKLDHTPVSNTLVFNFANDGKTATVSFHCSECDKNYTLDADVTSNVKTPASCEEMGITTYTATYLTYSDSIDLADIPVTGHTGVIKIDGSAAESCANPGYKDSWYCSVCDTYYEDEQLTKEIGDGAAYDAWIVGDGKLGGDHSLSLVPGQEATCSSTGKKDCYHCSQCDMYYEDSNATVLIGDSSALQVWYSNLYGGCIDVNAENHASELVHYDAVKETCMTDGNIEYWTCHDCGAIYIKVDGVLTKVNSIDDVTTRYNSDAHNYVYVPEVSATSSSDGCKEHYKCSICGDKFVKDANGNYVKVTDADLIIPKKGLSGCSGSVSTSALIISIISAIGVCLISTKRKEN